MKMLLSYVTTTPNYLIHLEALWEVFRAAISGDLCFTSPRTGMVIPESR